MMICPHRTVQRGCVNFVRTCPGKHIAGFASGRGILLDA
jgi:hypothetical protein